MKLEFSRQIFEKKQLKYELSSKSVKWEPSCSMRTDMTKLIVASRNFAKAPDKDLQLFTDTMLNTRVAQHKFVTCRECLDQTSGYNPLTKRRAAYWVLLWKPEGKTPRCIWEDNIKMVLREIRFGGRELD